MNQKRPLCVAIRADASSQIGLGHVKRCAALAAALLGAGARVCIVTRELGVDVSTAVADVRVTLLRLAPPDDASPPSKDPVPHAAWSRVAWETDAVQFVDAVGLAGWQPDWVVVDHYGFDARWHGRVKAALQARIAVIDDLADRDLDADLLIDQNLSSLDADKYASRLRHPAKRLLGPRFALLGDAYASAARYQFNEQVRSIGIFMGGVDAANLSSVALSACREDAGFTGPVEIVTTSANANLAALREQARRWPDTRVTVDLPDLTHFFAAHDLQIGAGGGAMWERCCIGAPTLALVGAQNQLAVLPALQQAGAVAMPADGFDQAAVGRAARALLNDAPRRLDLAKRSREWVDGLGSRRVALVLAQDRLSVRPALDRDAPTMYRWRNDPSTRKVSGDPSEIDWEAHVGWVRAVLADPRRRLLVGMVGAQEVGIIRFDAGDEGAYLVSLYLDPALHGLGLGGRLLDAGERELARATQPPHFVARVMPSNAASKRMFEACGYRLDTDGLWHKQRILHHSEQGPDS